MDEGRCGSSIDIDERLRGVSSSPPTYSIFRVHELVRRENEMAYEPDIVAIGPYHHGKDRLKGMEEEKLHNLRLFLDRKLERSAKKYVDAMKDLVERARGCYAEPVKPSCNYKFAEMMLLDGLFLIELFRKFKDPNEEETKNDPLLKMPWASESLCRDLLLLENQLPFFVLAELFRLTHSTSPPSVLIDFAIHFFREERKEVDKASLQPEHLLGLKHRLATAAAAAAPNAITNSNNNNAAPAQPADDKAIDIEKEEAASALKMICCVTELANAGVKFMAAEGEIFGISFNKGVMKIPTLIIDDRTESYYRNMIAYEQYCCQDTSNWYFTNYTTFMDCLINSPKDVEMLRSKEIINNYLGDDGIVSSMINKLGNHVIVPDHKEFSYADIFKRVIAHCNKPWYSPIGIVKWFGILKRKYFYSPWAFISFLAALTLLLLTITQTVFGIIK